MEGEKQSGREIASESQKVKTSSSPLAGGQIHELWSVHTTGSVGLKERSPFCATSGLCLKVIFLSKQGSHTGHIYASPFRRSPQSSQIHEHGGAGTEKLVFIWDGACHCKCT